MSVNEPEGIFFSRKIDKNVIIESKYNYVDIWVEVDDWHFLLTTEVVDKRAAKVEEGYCCVLWFYF